MAYIWPIILVVAANTVYHICAKSLPGSIDPFASLTVTYVVAAIASLGLYFMLNREADLIREYAKLNWAPFVLGIAIVGLETGVIYAYKAGWPVSSASVVQGAFLAIVLIVVGLLLYHEKITWNKLVGVALCLAGLVFINK